MALLGHKLGALPSSRCPLFSLFSAVAVLNGWPVRREVDFDRTSKPGMHGAGQPLNLIWAVCI